MSWLKFVNMFFFQWFGIRLAKECESIDSPPQRWAFLGFIVPCTGWSENNPYIRTKKLYEFVIFKTKHYQE